MGGIANKNSSDAPVDLISTEQECATMATNLLTVFGRKGMTKPKMGHKTRLWVDKGTGRQTPVAILGQQMRIDGKDRLIGEFQLFPFAVGSAPKIDGQYATSGEYRREQVDGQNKLVLGAVKIGNKWYVTTRTGLFPDDHGSTNADAMRLNGAGIQLAAHGSFSVDRASSALGATEGTEMDVESARRLKWAIKPSSIPMVGWSEFRHDLWEIPVGAEVLMRDIEGTLTLIIGRQDHLEVRDLTGDAAYNKMFEDFEAKRVIDARARRAQRRAAKTVQEETGDASGS